MQKKKTLWSKDFTVITLGTVISAIGGTAMNLAMGLVVFDNTASTWLTGFFAGISMLPSVIVPLLFAPYVDSHRRKPVIVGLDALLGVLYLLFALYLSNNPFSYTMYMGFGLITSTVGSMYSTAYTALYPDLIPEGFMQKGYSVSSVIYPTITMLMTPVAAALYNGLGITFLFAAEGVLLLIAASFEAMIRGESAPQAAPGRFSLKGYREELLGGVRYLKKEKGVRSLYTYMALTNAAGYGTDLMALAFFQSSAILTTTMYALLKSAETLGRTIGGVLHYFVLIPRHLRYRITVCVYYLYTVFDGALLLMPYPVMIIFRFCCGFLGVNSATLREAAVQHHLPSGVRGRVSSLFSVIISAAVILTQLLSGALGEVAPYPLVSLIFQGICLLAIYPLVMRGRREIEPLYDVEF